MGKDFRELLNEFNTAVRALYDGFKPEDWTNRANIYMHKLDRAEDLRIALLECDIPSGVEGELFKELCRKLDAAEDKLQDILQNKEGQGMNIIEKMRSDRFWCEMEDIEELYNIYLTDSEQFNTLMGAVSEWEGENMRCHLEGSWNSDQEVVEWYKRFKFMQAIYSYIYPWENSEHGIDLARNYSYYRGE